MPLYEYKCNTCGKTFEVIQKFSDDPITIHEGCGGATERLISAPAFHLKGSGWYATDYAKTNGITKPADSKPDSGSGDKSSESATSKSESNEKKADSTKSDSGASAGESKETKSAPAASTDSK